MKKDTNILSTLGFNNNNNNKFAITSKVP